MEVEEDMALLINSNKKGDIASEKNCGKVD
jgi:hypothetical protein